MAKGAKKDKKTKVIIKGYYGVKNLGDDFILLSILDILNKTNVDRLCIISYDDDYQDLCKKYPNLNIDVLNIKRSKSNKIKSFIGICASDHYIIGGGGLFPSGSIRTVIKVFLNILLAKAFHTKVIFYGVEITTMDNRLYKFIWKNMIRLTDFFAARNDFTYNEINMLGIDTPVYRCSDITFSYGDDFGEGACDEEERCILWALAMPWCVEELKNRQCHDRYIFFCKQMARCIEQVKRKGYRNCFLPFNSTRDICLIKDITNFLTDDLEMIEADCLSIQERRSVFKKATFVIAMRYHSILFSLYYAKPFMSISYSPKITNLLEENGFKTNYIEFGIRKSEFFGKEYDMDTDSLIDKIDFCLESQDKIKKMSVSAGKHLRSLAIEEKDLLIKWIEDGSQ